MPRPLTHKEWVRFLALMRRPRMREPLYGMCLKHYLSVVTIGYSTLFEDPNWVVSLSRHTRFRLAFREREGISPENLPLRCPHDQYRALSDGRHGGLLDLPQSDSQAFMCWYSGTERNGQYPFEIVAGDDAHGVVLRALPTDAIMEGWEFELSVHAPQLYPLAARMSLALERETVPFTFRDCERVIGGLVFRRQISKV